jgi:hypothetical protein
MNEEFKAFLELMALLIGLWIANVFIEDSLIKVGVNVSAVVLITSLQVQVALSNIFEKIESIKRELKEISAALNFLQFTLNNVRSDKINLHSDPNTKEL